jgi:hypothetical protein
LSDLENRLRRLERRLVWQPSIDEYLDASNRERTRALHLLAERLAPYGFDGDYLFVEANRQMLAEDTREWQAKDREIIEAWYRAQGIDAETEAEGAKEKLLAKLQQRSK